MSPLSRRAMLKAAGLTAVGSGLGYAYVKNGATGSAPVGHDGTPRRGRGAGAGGDSWRLRKRGRAGLSARGGGYADVAVRSDGRYAVVGTKRGTGGSFLVDLTDPAAPAEVHRLPPTSEVRNPDVAFDGREGLYYRVQSAPTGERNRGSSAVEIVDYGFDRGTPEDPTVVGYLGGGATHNLAVHPTEPLAYTVNYSPSARSRGFDVWDVADPSAPRKLGEAGPPGALHDASFDARRDLLHCAYMDGQFEGYAAVDVSDPSAPTEVGRFAYADRPGYRAVGEAGFRGAHYATADPRRGVVVLGDERPYGVPGGKHVLDVGWGEGSFEAPRHVGFTHSPNAREMAYDGDGDGRTDRREKFDWTGHDFDVVPRSDATLLVSGDYSEGVVLYDVTDPTAPTPLARYVTDDGAGSVAPNDVLATYGTPPRTWDARYCAERDFVVASDQFTGLYVLEVVPATAEEASATLRPAAGSE